MIFRDFVILEKYKNFDYRKRTSPQIGVVVRVVDNEDFKQRAFYALYSYLKHGVKEIIVPDLFDTSRKYSEQFEAHDAVVIDLKNNKHEIRVEQTNVY